MQPYGFNFVKTLKIEKKNKKDGRKDSLQKSDNKNRRTKILFSEVCRDMNNGYALKLP